jgi:prolyl oligopeptidase
MGRSNGGLLMGASITQRPDLFSAVECGYPLLDMLRYQKFEQGPLWTTEYGSADNEKQFAYLLKYSPYQNVKIRALIRRSVLYRSQRHARGSSARAQDDGAAAGGIRRAGGRCCCTTVSGGHSSGVSVEQEIQDGTDQLTFLWTETGQTNKQK